MLAILIALLVCGVASAQEHQPYAGMEQRAVKALSQQQIADLRAGRGMSLALAAELNGYPGPSHVLEHADALALTPAQRTRTQTLFDAMKGEAVPLGERLIEEETQLDGLFAARQIDLGHLDTITNEIGLTQARLRKTHLKYHLSMMDVLSPSQIEKYRELRGYAQQGSAEQHGPHPH
jgi:Spy/CpxP family protein refolding chaperone